MSENRKRKSGLEANQLYSLLNVDVLKDVSVALRFGTVIANSSILSLLSPILRTMICGDFREGDSKIIKLDGVEVAIFCKLLRFACGDEGLVANGVEELLELGGLAAFLQMDDVRIEIERMLLAEVIVDNCAEMYERSKAIGLGGLQKEIRKKLCDEFKLISQTQGFLELSEETVGELLDEDELGVDEEEDVLGALMRWKDVGEDRQRGEGLLRKIRFGVINDSMLAGYMDSAQVCGYTLLKEVVGEVMAKKGLGDRERTWDGVERVCDKWMVARRIKGRILGADVLKQPGYVAIDGQGRILVSDGELNQVIVFKSAGSVARSFGSQGALPGQFYVPTGIAVDSQGRIVIADTLNHRIQMLNADGSVARIFGSQGSAVGQLNSPFGVAIDNEGHIVVAEYNNHRIQVFNADGSVVLYFGSRGTAVGQLQFPAGVAVDRESRIVVADSGNHRVQVFQGDGSVALCFGSDGIAPGQLSLPHGVAVDREGRLVVADTDNDRVQVFNSDGSLARVLGAAGDGIGELIRPAGVLVDGAGRIVVVEGSTDDFDNHRVQIL